MTKLNNGLSNESFRAHPIKLVDIWDKKPSSFPPTKLDRAYFTESKKCRLWSKRQFSSDMKRQRGTRAPSKWGRETLPDVFIPPCDKKSRCLFCLGYLYLVVQDSEGCVMGRKAGVGRCGTFLIISSFKSFFSIYLVSQKESLRSFAYPTLWHIIDLNTKRQTCMKKE